MMSNFLVACKRICIKFSVCTFICLSLVACAGIGTSNYSFPAKLHQSSHSNIFFNENKKLISWNDKKYLPPFVKKRKQQLLTKLKHTFPIGLEIDLVKNIFLESGFTCEQNFENTGLACRVEGVSYSWKYVWPFPNQYLTKNERKLEVTFFGVLNIEDIAITQIIKITECPCQQP